MLILSKLGESSPDPSSHKERASKNRMIKHATDSIPWPSRGLLPSLPEGSRKLIFNREPELTQGHPAILPHDRETGGLVVVRSRVRGT